MNKRHIGLLFLVLLSIFSCKKKDDDSLLGLDVQPESDLVGITITDSSSLFMHTQKVDSVRTYNDQYKYLGSTLDPLFGRTDASIYTNFSIANNLTNLSFGTNPVLDSAEIVIRYAEKYIGDTTTKLNYDVYLLNENIQTATSYYTSKHFLRSAFKVNTSAGKYVVRGTSLCLVIPLDYNMAQYILQTESNLTNNTKFQSVNKGFYITTSNSTSLNMPGSGAIRYLNLDDDLSGVNLIYHDGNSVSSKSKIAQFTFRGTDALRLNHIDHFYNTGAALSLYNQLSGDTTKGNNNVYLNCFGGTRVRVYLPYLNSFSDSENVSISRAELIVKVDLSSSNSKYDFPPNLALIGCASTGEEELLYDQLENTDFVKYGGAFDSTKKQYVFNIARQMQKIITNKIQNYGFYLVNATPNKTYTVRRDNRLERVVLGGKNNITYKPIFKVTYVKYPYDK